MVQELKRIQPSGEWSLQANVYQWHIVDQKLVLYYFDVKFQPLVCFGK
jgi:hypothetical protein